jgi:hypothetical protein
VNGEAVQSSSAERSEPRSLVSGALVCRTFQEFGGYVRVTLAVGGTDADSNLLDECVFMRMRRLCNE